MVARCAYRVFMSVQQVSMSVHQVCMSVEQVFMSRIYSNKTKFRSINNVNKTRPETRKSNYKVQPRIFTIQMRERQRAGVREGARERENLIRNCSIPHNALSVPSLIMPSLFHPS
jgi:hypothetical protein